MYIILPMQYSAMPTFVMFHCRAVLTVVRVSKPEERQFDACKQSQDMQCSSENTLRVLIQPCMTYTVFNTILLVQAFSRLCKAVHPWGHTSEIQSIRERPKLMMVPLQMGQWGRDCILAYNSWLKAAALAEQELLSRFYYLIRAKA